MLAVAVSQVLLIQLLSHKSNPQNTQDIVIGKLY